MPALALTVVTVALYAIADVLCFGDSTFGGIAPLLAITAGPAVGYCIGRASQD